MGENRVPDMVMTCRNVSEMKLQVAKCVCSY